MQDSIITNEELKVQSSVEDYIAHYLQVTTHAKLQIHRNNIQYFWNHPCFLYIASVITITQIECNP